MRYYFLIIIIFASITTARPQVNKGQRTLIVVFDGLRPDYITAENMPNVFALKKEGCTALDNHSVFPTVTRVNASSYATGSYPAKHGLLGNTVYFPEVDRNKGLDTGDAKELMRITDITHDRLLTSSSLGEILQQAGARMMVFSSGSTGQAFLQNHTLSGGAVINPELILPAEFAADVNKKIGMPPASAEPNRGQHDWATRALIQFGLAPDGPLVNAIWFSDPDGTAHRDGMGAPSTMASIKIVDDQFGKIMAALKAKDLLRTFNIIITADHGFVTNAGTQNLSGFLIQQGLKKGPDSDDVILAGNALYVKDHDPEVIRKIVSALQQQAWVGAIFTKSAAGQSTNGWVEGTLSFETIFWNHPRAADILVDYNWDKTKNSHGYEGTSFAKGVAGHGGSSPYEIHIPLIASGPGFRARYESAVPTSNIDIVPTILYLNGLPIPPEMDGRVMSELLKEGPATNDTVKKEIVETSVEQSWGTYKLILERSRIGNHYYINYTQVERIY
jgi:arylsulfatase A-like enzyme